MYSRGTVIFIPASKV